MISTDVVIGILQKLKTEIRLLNYVSVFLWSTWADPIDRIPEILYFFRYLIQLN